VGKRRWLVGLVLGVSLVVTGGMLMLVSSGRANGARVDPGLLQKLCSEDWYAVSLADHRAGYWYTKARLERVDAAQSFVSYTEAVITVAAYGQVASVKLTLTEWADDQLQPFRYHMFVDQLGQTRTVDAERNGQELHVATKMAGRTTTKTLKLDEKFGSEAEVALRALRGELKQGDKFSITIFNPETADLDENVVEVKERQKRDTLDGPQELQRVDVTSQSLGMATIMWLNPQGVAEEMVMPALLNARMARVTEQDALAEASPLAISGNVDVKEDLGDPEAVAELKLAVQSTSQPVADILPVTHRQALEAGASAYAATLTIAPAKAPQGQTATLPIQDPLVADCLQATEFIQSDDPALLKKAHEIVGGEKDAWKAACAIRKWVYDNVKKQDSYPAPITAKQVLDGLEGDCSEHAMLFVGLARAAGIPSKFVAGLVYTRGAFWYHAWNEVYVGSGSWIAVDPTWNEPVADATHITLGEGAMDAVSFCRVCLATGRSMGNLKLAVLEYTDRAGQVHKPAP
jgi:hypothetical protein